MRSAFPFMVPMESDRYANPLETWMKPGQEAFRFWISFFPTAPLFGVEWRFATMVDPAVNPFMMPGLPGMRAAATAAHPGELDSPAAADEDAAKPAARAAETVGDAVRDMTRIAGETGKAVADTAGTALLAGTDAAKTALDAQSRAVDLAEEIGKSAKQATETAVTAAQEAAEPVARAAATAAEEFGDSAKQATETAVTAAEETGKSVARAAATAAEETAGAAGKAGRRGAEAATEAVGTAARKQAEAADDVAEAVDDAIAATPKPKMLLDKRPDETDDLKAIKGIGPDLERQLNGLGLYRFDQLAKMSKTDLAWIDANITRFKGRIFRDDWVGQAKSRLGK